MIKVADKSKTVKMWNSRTYFPQDNYIARIIGEDRKPSSAGNAMTTLEWEIVNCDPKKIGDETVEFDGSTFLTYHVTQVNPSKDVTPDEAAQKSENAFNTFDEFLTKCGVDTSEGWDPQNPPSVKGKVLHVRLYGEDRPAYAALTPEEKAEGKKVGRILKDPITNKEVHNYGIKLSEVYGIFDGEVRPF